MKKVLVIHGANLNLLGLREPEIYGKKSLYELNKKLYEEAEKLGLYLVVYQTNSESQLLESIHNAKDFFDFIIINPGAFTHTSIAIRDALLSVGIPFIEVHLSNIFSREDFRKHSFLSDIAKGVITGLGEYSYILALRYIAENES